MNPRDVITGTTKVPPLKDPHNFIAVSRRDLDEGRVELTITLDNWEVEEIEAWMESWLSSTQLAKRVHEKVRQAIHPILA